MTNGFTLSPKTAKKLYETIWNKENLLPDRDKVFSPVEVAEGTQKGTIKNYRKEIEKKQSSKISSQEIVLEKEDKSLQAIFITNTSCLDNSNFQNGIVDNSYLERFKSIVNKLDRKDGKIVVFMTNFMGKEWKFSFLLKEINKIMLEHGLNSNNAEEELKSVVRNYYGINKRKKVNQNIINTFLRLGVDEIYLMKGAEEFDILKETGRDVCEELKKDIDSNKVKYIAEGTETKINVVKKTGNKSYFATIKLENNNMTKSAKASYAEKPMDYYEDNADVTFKCSGNYTGAQKHLNIFYPSGQSTYLNTVKGKNPKFMQNDGNVYQLIIEGNHDVSVVLNPSKLADDNWELLNELYTQEKLNKEIIKQIQKDINEKLNVNNLIK